MTINELVGRYFDEDSIRELCDEIEAGFNIEMGKDYGHLLDLTVRRFIFTIVSKM